MAAGHGRDQDSSAVIEELLEEILTDAYGDDEQLWAFRQAFEDNIALPADAFVIGEPVSLVAIDYDGNERRGLTATCWRQGDVEHVVAVSEVSFPEGSDGARHVAAYRKWLGLEPMDREKFRVLIRSLRKDDLLRLLDRAIDLVPKTRLRALAEGFLDELVVQREVRRHHEPPFCAHPTLEIV